MRSARLDITADEFPTFLYDENMLYDENVVEVGLLRGQLLLKVRNVTVIISTCLWILTVSSRYTVIYSPALEQRCQALLKPTRAHQRQ